MNGTPAWLGDASLIFVSLLVQGVPFLLIGSFVGGLLSDWVPLTTVLRRWPKNAVLSAICGAMCALLIPACDCAVIPIVRRLIRKGAPLSGCIAYVMAAPVLNPICLISTWLAFRLGAPWEMVALRAGGSLLIAVVAGIVMSRFPAASLIRADIIFRSSADTDSAPWMDLRPSPSQRKLQASSMLGAGLTDFFNVSTLYVLGAMCSALLQTFVPLGKIIAPHSALGIPAAMLLAFLFSLCSSADAFVVNAFGSLGLAGQLAFLWLGPVYNLRTLFLYRGVFHYRAIFYLGLLIILLVALLAVIALNFR